MANTNTFQIIGGTHRGRKFDFTDAPGLRPTPNKVRETLFNWIQFESANAVFLDLFSGSGALSFEALSRGAKHVVGIEKNFDAYQNLEKNRKLLKSDKIQFLNQDALHFLSTKATQSYDFALLDPPFNKNLVSKTLKALKNSDFVTTKSKIYIESEFEITLDFLKENFSEKIKINQQKQSGQVNYCLLEVL